MNLTELEKALEAYEAAQHDYQIALTDTADYAREEIIQEAASTRKELHQIAPEALRSLLAVAKAASVLMKASPDYDTYKLKEDTLKEALKELEE